jgi:single-stranded DNA-binding protein
MIVMGIVATDPEKAQGKSGEYVRFRLAERYRNFLEPEDSEKAWATNWFTVVCYGDLQLASLLRKKMRIRIKGFLSVQPYQADGQKLGVRCRLITDDIEIVEANSSESLPPGRTPSGNAGHPVSPALTESGPILFEDFPAPQ